MLVSILIAAYNVDEYLENCLISCINQTYREIEIIVVNDGSTDNTKKIAETISLFDNRIKLINKANGGLVSARKSGVDTSKGEYVFFLDGDDTIPENAIESLIINVKEFGSDIVFGKQKIIDKDNEIRIREHEVENNSNISYLKSVFNNSMPNIVGAIFKIDLVKKINYHTDLYKSIDEDLVSIVQLLNYAIVVSKTKGITYNYHRRDNSITMNEINLYANGFDAIYITYKYLIKYKLMEILMPEFIKPLKIFVFGYLVSSVPLFYHKEKISECVNFIIKNNLQNKLALNRKERIILNIAALNLKLARLSIISGRKLLKKS